MRSVSKKKLLLFFENMKAYQIVKGSSGSYMLIIKKSGILFYEIKDVELEKTSFMDLLRTNCFAFSKFGEKRSCV